MRFGVLGVLGEWRNCVWTRNLQMMGKMFRLLGFARIGGLDFSKGTTPIGFEDWEKISVAVSECWGSQVFGGLLRKVTLISGW